MTWILMITWYLPGTPANRSTWCLWIQCNCFRWGPEVRLNVLWASSVVGILLRTHVCHAGTGPGESRLCVQHCAASACLTRDVRSWARGRPVTTLSGVEQKIVLAPSNGTLAVELKNLQVFSSLYRAQHLNLTLRGQVQSLALNKYFFVCFCFISPRPRRTLSPPVRSEYHQVPYVAICWHNPDGSLLSQMQKWKHTGRWGVGVVPHCLQ